MQTEVGVSLYFEDIRRALDAVSTDAIERLVDVLIEAGQSHRNIFVLGNGGSAATASHFACDLGKGTRSATFPKFRVIALTDNVPLITAWANDVNYGDVFAEQLENFCQPGDVVIAISASGMSPNILKAAEVARGANATVVALTGAGGLLGPSADLWISTPANCIEQVEDLHLIVQHLVCCQIRGRI
jgi:D-sedoheptulose 7-phosphate isomerase